MTHFRCAAVRLLLVLIGLTLCSTVRAQTVDNGRVALRFDPTRGGLVSLRDVATGYELVSPSPDSPLWEVELLAPGIAPIRSIDAATFSYVEHVGDSPSLEMTWTGFAQPGLQVVATVSAPQGSDTANWRIRVESTEPMPMKAVHFPRITGVTPRENEEVAVPIWMGERTWRARELLNNADGTARRQEWEYPGILSLQFIAVYGGNAPGLYFASNDIDARRKKVAMFGDGKQGLGMEVVHLPEADPELRVFEQIYDVIAGPFVGDWFSAAERYRAWGNQQSWVRESRLKQGLVPTWVLDSGLWIWNRGRSPGVLGPAEALQSASGMPVTVFWHWWHGCAYDTGFPEYLPPREGADAFRDAVAAAHDKNLHAIVYMNQRLWGTQTESWSREGAEQFAVKGENGKPHVEVYNIFTKAPCAPMCMGTSFWRNKYADLVEGAVVGLGIDGIYMDQACLSLSCYDKAHGHTLGGGRYWMEGFRTLTADIRKRSASRPPVTLAGEGCGEAWLPQLDLMLSLQVSMERYASPGAWEPLPMFQSVYHDSAVMYGNYSSLTYPPYDDLWPAEFAPKEPLKLLDQKFSHQFRMEQARSFLWGQQMTVANFMPEQLTNRADEIAFVLRLARIRRELRDFLQHGVMLRPPVIDVPVEEIPMSRLSIYAGQQDQVKEFSMKTPLVRASAWRAADGRVALFFVNTSTRAIPVTFTANASVYGLRTGKYEVLGEEGHVSSTSYDGDAALELEVPAQGVRVVMFKAP